MADILTALGTALTGVLGNFTDALVVIVPVTFGIAGLVLVVRKIRAQIK